MISITRRFSFDAGHRVLNHEGKCKNLHGHTYYAEVTIEHKEDKLDALGRVIDFGIICKLVGGFIDNELDHGMILNIEDRTVIQFMIDNEQKFYVLPCNPTAENIAKFLLTDINNILVSNGFGKVICTSVKIQETANCSATFINDL